jgi:hypothetical protein
MTPVISNSARLKAGHHLHADLACPFASENLEKIEGVSAPTKAKLPWSFRTPERFA